MKRKISFSIPVAIAALLSAAVLAQNEPLKPFRPGQPAAEEPQPAVPLKPFRPGTPEETPKAAPVKPAEFVIIRIGLWTAHAED